MPNFLRKVTYLILEVTYYVLKVTYLNPRSDLLSPGPFKFWKVYLNDDLPALNMICFKYLGKYYSGRFEESI